jgi:hypothetical protein
LEALHRCLAGTAPFLERQTLATFATNARARGLSTDLIKDQIKEILSNTALTRGLDDSDLQLLAGVPDVDWAHLRFSDKRNIAESKGFLTIDDAINSIDRPYLFRAMLAPEVALGHKDNPYKDKAYDARPWNERERKLLENLGSIPVENPTVSGDLAISAAKVAAEIRTHGRGCEVPKQIIFVPADVVVSDTLCTLRTAL